VAGRIQLARTIFVRYPYLTVAGQTAPGDGITISATGAPRNSNGLFSIQTHDLVFRYLRLRHGYSATAGSGMAFYIENNAYNVMIDHVSMSWSQQEHIAMWPSRPGSRNVSLQWSMLFDTLQQGNDAAAGGSGGVEANHNVGANFGAFDPRTGATVTDIDIHHNYLTDGSRLPLFKVASGSLVENVIYNWSYFATLSGGGALLDIVNNRYKAGPVTQRRAGDSRGVEILAYSNPSCISCGPVGTPSIFVSGNIAKDGAAPADPWSITGRVDSESVDGLGPIPLDWRRTSERVTPAGYVKVSTVAPGAEALVLATAGASRRLDCDGTWIPNRDRIDAAAVTEYTSNTGRFKPTEADAGGFVTTAVADACADADLDGIPDAYELAACGTSTCLSPNGLQDDGYTNLEHYLNGLPADPARTTSARPATRR
jgi:hypothetical protein